MMVFTRTFFVALILQILSLSPSQAAVLILDDGTAEQAIGLTGGGTILIFNQFDGSGIVTDVLIDWGGVANGTSFDIGIWSDPNGDGNPSDAVLLSTTLSQTVTNANPFAVHVGVFNLYNVADTPVGPSFFVGFQITHLGGEFPASIDQTSSAGQSWAAVGGFSN